MSQTALAQDFVRKIPLLGGFPQTLAGQQVKVEIPKVVRLRLRSPEKIKVSEWAKKNRIVAEGAHTGPWRHELAPHTVKIMDTFGLPWVREVWFCGVEQSGKTNTMLNCLGWAIDCDPGGIFYLMPTEDASGKTVGEKMRPMIQKSKNLARYLSKKQDDASLGKIKLQHGVTIFPAWANSPTSMATFAAKHCFGDEVDKYPEMAGKEADPITLLKKRNRNYKGRYKRMFGSTPAQKFIYKGMWACDQVWEFRVKCQDCGKLIKMAAKHLLIPEGANAETVEREGVAYECNSCKNHWTDQDRETAIRSGRWVCVKGTNIARPTKVGFHHRSWECLDIPLTEIAAAWLRAEKGELVDKIAWANGYAAIDYEHVQKERQEDGILKLCDTRPEAVVPTWTDALEISIDTQDNGFWYRIRAWEYGVLNSALVKSGFVESFDVLDNLIYESTYPDANGKEYSIIAGIIDTGGHRTSEVYDWCRRPGSIVLGAKGASGRKTQPVSVSKLDHYPGGNKPIPGGLRLYHVDTHFHKDALSAKLSIAPGDPGCFWLHSGYTDLQLKELSRENAAPIQNGLKEYARQMCAEFRNEKGMWDCPSKKPNHLWDCESNGLALVFYLNFRNRIKEGEKPKPKPKKSTAPRSSGRARPSWFNRR